ncbi:hypothetical protein NDU88_000838 [Pleurodeles waltl]|uniref:Uncharacterized protein n=1 Tax=Pleurodeles waltl TaxID=8319 RepID=A0AAV7U8B7_PLEWA|nr:hypothetical protein NDU88_000838 [Pleurodeles waltl]
MDRHVKRFELRSRPTTDPDIPPYLRPPGRSSRWSRAPGSRRRPLVSLSKCSETGERSAEPAPGLRARRERSGLSASLETAGPDGRRRNGHLDAVHPELKKRGWAATGAGLGPCETRGDWRWSSRYEERESKSGRIA